MAQQAASGQQAGQQQVQQQGQKQQGQQQVQQQGQKQQQADVVPAKSSPLVHNLAIAATAIENCLVHDRHWPELGDILTRMSRVCADWITTYGL